MQLEERAEHPTSETDAVRIVRELYGLAAVARLLPGEYDDNFQIKANDGREFVLKAMHPARERAFVEMQCQALRHLAQRAPQLALPRVVPMSGGEFFSEIKTGDGARIVWMLTFVKGTELAKVKPHSPELLNSLGVFLGEMDGALQSFAHQACERKLKWDSSRASWAREYTHEIADAKQRTLVENVLQKYQADTLPVLPTLRRSVIYGDANDYNVLVNDAPGRPRRVVSVIDFGDMHSGVTVSELAIAVAYAILRKSEPLAAAASLVAGYHEAFPLEERELSVLHTLVAARLAVSVTNSAHRKIMKPDDAYVTVSEAPAWEALERWMGVHPRFAEYTFRAACGLGALGQGAAVCGWLKANAGSLASIVGEKDWKAKCWVFDLSVGSTFLGADPAAGKTSALTGKIFKELGRSGAAIGVGRYDEARLLYTAPFFKDHGDDSEEWRTIHLGIDLFGVPGTALFAPMDGIVHTLANNSEELDYGPLVILAHTTPEGQEFYTLYGHLTLQTLNGLKVGQKIAREEEFARIGDVRENGGWAPHVHFQIILDLLDLYEDFPGVAKASERAVWTAISPDPNLILGIPAEKFPVGERTVTEILSERGGLLGRNLSVSYEKPLNVVRGWKQFLYDQTGQEYLDVYNNVPLVGHSHPRVVKAAQEQLGLLNTNTRYLHENLNRYAGRLGKRLPPPLKVCFFVNSGSEANELALRLARAYTGKEDVIVLEHAYHGNTNTLIDISPYKFDGAGGRGKKPWVHVAPLPDDYRGLYRRDDGDRGARYARHVGQILETAKLDGRGVAAFIAETLPSVGGQIVFPENYLSEVYRHVHVAGGVCIADEVQVGFGRLGSHFWGFATQGVIPDIVVLGKPIGNGFPLAAVITTEEIADAFGNGMEFFSTFGGNPVACATGLAVLDVLEEERLQENARAVGEYWIAGIRELQKRHLIIGDVRGTGLFLGIDLVADRESRAAAPGQASHIVNRLRERRILAGTDGPLHNVIKLRPPLCFTENDADQFCAVFGEILEEDAARV